MPRPTVLAALCVLLAAGCAAPSANLVQNPGFEEGERAWFWLDWSPAWQGPFEVANGTAHGGDAALRLRLEPHTNQTIAIRGAVQEFTHEALEGAVPETLSGHYRVERWAPGTEKTYAQVVLGFYPDESGKPACERAGTSPCQLAYVLTGIDEAPFSIVNRRFLFTAAAEPQVGEWVRFEVRPRDDYLREWGEVPSAFRALWIYLEVRAEYPSDLAEAERRPGEVDVLWDDLRLGP